jgi:uncharacterized protein YbaP (TraB family)
LSALRESERIEREQWTAIMARKLQAQLSEKEKALSERLMKERDDEIQMIIARLGMRNPVRTRATVLLKW